MATNEVFGDQRIPLRIWLKVSVTEGGCWEWQGGKNSYGYGYTFLNGKRSIARLFYMILVGSIPSNLLVDHLCRTRHCVNPSHMELVTNKESLLRGVGWAAINARKTHCTKGHPYLR